jgi:hypothetical protein
MDADPGHSALESLLLTFPLTSHKTVIPNADRERIIALRARARRVMLPEERSVLHTQLHKALMELERRYGDGRYEERAELLNSALQRLGPKAKLGALFNPSRGWR